MCVDVCMSTHTGYEFKIEVMMMMIACSVSHRTNNMYQVPVNDLAKLRRSRKRVKSILCDIALQNCQDLIEVSIHKESQVHFRSKLRLGH